MSSAPLEGLSFHGALSTAFDGVVLFSSAAGVTAYNGSTGTLLWSAPGAVPEGTDRRPRRIYLTEGSNLVGVDPQTGRVEATVSGSAVNGAAGVYVVRNGVALGLDQGGNGGAWGYDLAVQRITLAAAGLPWPHYFVDLERRRRQRRPGRQPGDHRGLHAAGTESCDPAERIRIVRVPRPVPVAAGEPGGLAVVRHLRVAGHARVGWFHAEPRRQPVGLGRRRPAVPAPRAGRAQLLTSAPDF